MVRLRTSLFLPMVVLAAILFLNQSGMGDTSGVGYSVAVAVNALASLGLMSALGCLAAAREAQRMRRGHLLTAPGSRSLPQRLAAPLVLALIPPLGWAVLRFFLDGVLLTLPGALLLMVLAVQYLAWALLGIALGVWLPGAVSLPLAAIIPTVVPLFLPANPVRWLRYLTGYLQVCCQTDETLNPDAVVITLLFSLGLAALSYCLVCAQAAPGARTRRLATWGGLATGLTCAALAMVLASRIPGTVGPTLPRDQSHLVCQRSDTLQVCVWPENRTRLDPTLTALARVHALWSADGVALPERFSEGATTRTATETRLELLGGLDHEATTLGLAHSVAYAPCQQGQAPLPVEVLDEQERAIAWLFLVAEGKPPRPELRESIPEAVWAEAARWRTEPGARQNARLRQALTTVSTCR